MNYMQADIRHKLQDYIDKGDDKLLKLMYALAKEYYEDEQDFEFKFSEEDINEFDERRNKRLSGVSKTYSWREAKDIITGNKQENGL